MTGRRAIAGLCMLCALLVSAFAAQSASAKGETAFTCVTNSGGPFLGQHCLTSGQGGSGSASEHVAFAGNTAITGTNAKTKTGTTAAAQSILKVTIAGTPLEMVASEVTGSGTMENAEVSGEMVAKGTGKITYKGVEVKKPEGKGCTVKEDNGGVEGTTGTVVTNNLKATTVGESMVLKFEPETGTTFATFFIKCTGEVPEALTGTWTVTGSLQCPTIGATTTCSHENVTTQNTLKAKGSKAGLEGSITISGPNNPLVTTTTP